MLTFAAGLFLNIFAAPQHSHPWIENAFCLFKENVKKSIHMFWTGDGKLLLVSCADVIEHMPNFNLRFYSALAEASWKWPFKLPASLWHAPINKKIKQQRVGSTNQMESNLFTSPLIKTPPVHVCAQTYFLSK